MSCCSEPYRNRVNKSGCIKQLPDDLRASHNFGEYTRTARSQRRYYLDVSIILLFRCSRNLRKIHLISTDYTLKPLMFMVAIHYKAMEVQTDAIKNVNEGF